MLNHTIAPAIKRLDLSDENVKKLIELGEEKHEEYLNNTPFSHMVFDNFFPDEVLDTIVQEFEQITYDGKKDFYGASEKYYTNNLNTMGPTTQRFLLDLNSSKFCVFLEALTGIKGVIPDPYFEGGGIHMIRQGGFLKIHTDFNWYEKLQLDRRINVLIYLNRNWKDEWGGHLEVRNKNMKNPKKIAPLFNRMVIFSTTDFSYHGHPDPLQCPLELSRKSLALYYYSQGRPREEVVLGRSIGTNYRPRKIDNFRDRFLERKLSYRIKHKIKRGFEEIRNFFKKK